MRIKHVKPLLLDGTLRVINAVFYTIPPWETGDDWDSRSTRVVEELGSETVIMPIREGVAEEEIKRMEREHRAKYPDYYKHKEK